MNTDTQDQSNLQERSHELISKRQWGEAIALYQTMETLSPLDPHIKETIGDLNYVIGNVEGCIENYARAAQVFLDQHDVLKAVILAKKIKTIQPDLEFIKKLLRSIIRYDRKVSRLNHNERIALSNYPFLPLIHELSITDFYQFLDRFQHLKASEHTLLFSKGDAADKVFLVISGAVAIVKQTADSTLDISALSTGTTVLATLRKGDFFGEFGFLTNEKRQASAVTLEATEFLVIGFENLKLLMNKYPEISDKIIGLYRRRVVVNLLGESETFGGLSLSIREAMASALTFHRYEAGDYIIKEGEHTNFLCILKSGEVEVNKHKDNGDKLVLTRLHPGAIFGEMTVITGQPRTANIVAKSRVEVGILTKEKFKDVVELTPEIFEQLKNLVKSRIQNTVASIDNLIETDNLPYQDPPVPPQAGEQATKPEEAEPSAKDNGETTLEPHRQTYRYKIFERNILVSYKTNQSYHVGTLYDISEAGLFIFVPDPDLRLKGANFDLKITDTESMPSPFCELHQMSLPVSVSRVTQRGLGLSIRHEALPLTSQIRWKSVIQAMSKARIANFIYPAYEISMFQIYCDWKSDSQNGSALIKSISVTELVLIENKKINRYERMELRLLPSPETEGLFNTPLTLEGLVTNTTGQTLAIELDYFSERVKTVMGQLIRGLAKRQGYLSSIENTTPGNLSTLKQTEKSQRISHLAEFQINYKNAITFVRDFSHQISLGKLFVLTDKIIAVDQNVKIKLHLENFLPDSFIGQETAYIGKVVRSTGKGLIVALEHPIDNTKTIIEQVVKEVREQNNDLLSQKILSPFTVAMAKSTPDRQRNRQLKTALLLILVLFLGWVFTTQGIIEINLKSFDTFFQKVLSLFSNPH